MMANLSLKLRGSFNQLFWTTAISQTQGIDLDRTHTNEQITGFGRGKRKLSSQT